MQGRIKLIFLLLLAVLFGRAQTISQYEYWLDADYGHRHTVATNSTDVEQSIDISSLSEGIHYLNFRAEDGDGVSGLYHRYLFMVPASEMTDATVSGYEYWIDADYAHRVSSSVASTDITQSIDVSTLSSGIHYLNFRAKRTDGEPGLYYRYLFVVPDKEEVTLQIDQVKFWIDDDEQNSQTMKVEAGSEIAISMDISQLEAGSTHTFNINAVSTDGLETPLGSYEFTLEAPADPEPYAVLTEVNSTPGEGTIVPNNSRAETATTSNYTLTFYYDTMKAERNGMSVGPFELPQDRGWESVAQNITTVEFDASMANDTTITSTAYWFYGCQELTSIIGMENLKTQSVTDMKYMFYGCNELEHVDVSGFNTANVTDMSGMFYKCHRMQDLDLSNFNTFKVKNMSWMFYGCYDITRIYAGSYWTTTSVTESEEMFMNCTNLVGGHGTTYDENRIDYTFAHIDGGASNPGYFTDKNATIVTNPEPYAVLSEDNTVLTFYYDDQKEARNGMSVGPFGSPNARGWHNDTESITTVVFDDSFANDTVLTSMYCWFYNCSNLTKIEGISNLHTAMVTDMTGLFSGCTKLASLDLTGFNTANVTIMYGMFQQCYSLNTIDVTNFNTAKVEDMRYMFSECSGLTTLDLSSFNVSNVTYMDELFAYCSALTTIYVGSEWLIDSEKTSGPHMFRNCQKLVGGKGTTYDSNHLHVDYAHIDGGPDNPGYFTQSGSEPYVGPKEQVATPKIQFEDEKILLTTETEDATIYYAIKPFDNAWDNDSINRLADELVVSDGSTVYQDPIYANEDFIIKAMAAKEGMENSENATYIYPYTEWQSLIQTTYVVMVRIEDATRDYTPSDALQAKIDQLKTQIAYIHDVYNRKRTEWDRDRVRAERNNLELFGYDLEIQITVEKTESNAATYENLVLSVKGQTTMTKALELVGGRDVVAKDIAAIVWNSTEPINRSDIEGFGNPNLLIYVQTESLAPEGVNNVVVDGKAKNIVLVDAEGNNNFYAPQEFTAESISYTREFKQTTQKDVSRGWEGICLPFTVQTYTHESHGAIAPFRNNASDYHFWLRQMTDKGLTTAENIEANMPYIISMPNSDAYPEAYNQAGKVTFAAENAKISKSTAVGIQLADRPIIVSGTYHSIATGYYALNVGHEYEGNPEGSIFVLNYREIRPFEVFTWHNGSGARSISLSSLFGGEGTTDIIDVIAEPNGDTWYDMNGRRLQSKPVRKGIYIKNGKKVVIK